MQVFQTLLHPPLLRIGDPHSLHWSAINRFQQVYQWLKKQGVIKKFFYLDEEILIALDGTEYFSSKKISCPYCVKYSTLVIVTNYF